MQYITCGACKERVLAEDFAFGVHNCHLESLAEHSLAVAAEEGLPVESRAEVGPTVQELRPIARCRSVRARISSYNSNNSTSEHAADTGAPIRRPYVLTLLLLIPLIFISRGRLCGSPSLTCLSSRLGWDPAQRHVHLKF